MKMEINNLLKQIFCLFKTKTNLINSILYYIVFKRKILLVFWWTGMCGKNVGDALNPLLVKSLSGKKPVLYNSLFKDSKNDVYLVIGSILEMHSSKNDIIWGSGFIAESGFFREVPKKICAVRGPLTRNLILKQGIDCPEIYGDPALLYPLFYKPLIKKKYTLGIIPHYIDNNNSTLKSLQKRKDVVIIDILSGINNVVDSICECDLIASSSLHGIILSDAYGVPSIWIEFSDKIAGNRFKFYDYFLSVGRNNEFPLFIDDKSNIEDIYNQYRPYKLQINLIELLDSCPFLDNNRRNEYVDKLLHQSKAL